MLEHWRLGSQFGRQIVVLLLCATMLVGCGGGGDTQDDQAQKQTLKANRPAPRKKQQAGARSRKSRKSKKRTVRVRPKGTPIPPLVEDQFVIVSNADEFLPTNQQPEPEITKIASIPRPGNSSSDFELVSNDGASRSSSGSRRGGGGAPEGFEPIPEAGMTDEGLPRRIRCLKDGSEMVLIPAGASLRGINDGPPGHGPEHLVQLDDYYIDVYEVTLQQYEVYREDLRTNKKRVPKALESPTGRDLPATGMMWGEAKNYARWAGKALPTEAEWERAARGPEGFKFPWGRGKPIWHLPRKMGQIDPVGTFRGDVSPFGVVDMAGNVLEWCEDWYSPTAYEDAIAKEGGTLRNPNGPRAAIRSEDRTARVTKGGLEGWEVWRRTATPMGTRSPQVGFRCVLRDLKGLSAKGRRSRNATF